MSKLTIDERRRFDACFSAVRSMPKPIPAADRYRHTVEHLEVGGFVRYDGRVYQVQGKHLYREGAGNRAWRWNELELFCLQTGEIVYAEYERDDALEVSVTTKMGLSFHDLKDDEGGAIDEDDLEDITRDEEDVVYHGTVYAYEDDCDATFYRHGITNRGGEKVWIIDFKSRDGSLLSIEEWNPDAESPEYDLSLSKEVSPDAFDVLVLKGA